MSTATDKYFADSFASYPMNARIWLFGLDNNIALNDQEIVADRLNRFIDTWQSHGNPVKGSFAIIENRFILIITGNTVSGCSTDSLFREVQATIKPLGVNLASPLSVFYRKPDGSIHFACRSIFRELVRTGEVKNETTVFNLALSEYKSLDQGDFETPLQESIFSSFSTHAA